MQELRDIQAAELKRVADDAVGYFRQNIERRGVVFTGELLQDFETFMVQNSEAIAVDISFNFYGRLKDMKVLEWQATMPPIEVMEEYVAKVGVEKFAWVPGYEQSDKVPARTIAVKRIAWAISMSFRNKAVRRKQGNWYNQTKMEMVNIARRSIMNVTAQYLAEFVKDGLEGKE